MCVCVWGGKCCFEFETLVSRTYEDNSKKRSEMSLSNLGVKVVVTGMCEIKYGLVHG